ncbi:MAG: TetR/AcrR family transcriptional regulator [Nocardioidaceae bacterium]
MSTTPSSRPAPPGPGRSATGRRPRPADERILAAAFRLFYARGIRAVGVDLVIAEAEVAKATFYKHYPAKDDLVLAYLDRVDGLWTRELRRAAAVAGPTAADRLVGLFDALVTTGARAGYRGCAFLNVAAEAVPGGRVHRRAVEHKLAVLGWVQSLAGDAGAPDPAGLARTLTLLLDGALAAGTMDADPRAARLAADTARAVVSAAVPAPGLSQPG